MTVMGTLLVFLALLLATVVVGLVLAAIDKLFVEPRTAPVTVVSKQHVTIETDPHAESARSDALRGYGEPLIIPERFRITIQDDHGQTFICDVSKKAYDGYEVRDRATLRFIRGRLTGFRYPMRLLPADEGRVEKAGNIA